MYDHETHSDKAPAPTAGSSTDSPGTVYLVTGAIIDADEVFRSQKDGALGIAVDRAETPTSVDMYVPTHRVAALVRTDSDAAHEAARAVVAGDVENTTVGTDDTADTGEMARTDAKGARADGGRLKAVRVGDRVEYDGEEWRVDEMTTYEAGTVALARWTGSSRVDERGVDAADVTVTDRRDGPYRGRQPAAVNVDGEEWTPPCPPQVRERSHNRTRRWRADDQDSEGEDGEDPRLVTDGGDPIEDMPPVEDQDGNVIAEPDRAEKDMVRCIECGEGITRSKHAIANHVETEHRDAGEEVQVHDPVDAGRDPTAGVQSDPDAGLMEVAPIVDGDESQIGLRRGTFGALECIDCGDEFDTTAGLATHYGTVHRGVGPDELDAFVQDRNEEVEAEKPSNTADSDSGATAADEGAYGTAADIVEQKQETKAAGHLWRDAASQYEAASEQASRVTKADARKAAVTALKKEAEWMSVRERSSKQHADLWYNRGDTLDPWHREGRQRVAERMNDEIGVHATSREISHVTDHLAYTHAVDEDELNRGDDDGLYVRVANGVIDIDAIEVDGDGRIDTDSVDIEAPKPGDRWTYCVNTEWDPEAADLDGLDEWLAEVQTPTAAARGEYWTTDQELWWEFAGASLTTESLDDGFLQNLGDGAAGKSMVLKLLKSMLGSDNTSSMSIQKIQSNRFAAYQVVDKLANIDTELSGTALNGMEKLKSMAAGEEQHVEDKGESGFFTTNNATMICAADNPPALPQDNNAAGRRLYLIEYPCKYTEDPDPDSVYEKQKLPKRQVEDVLHSEERQKAALVRAVEGLARLKESGEYTTDMTSNERLEAYKSYADPIADFADVCLMRKPGAQTHWADIDQTFDNFGGAKGHPGKNWQTLKNQLEKLKGVPMRRTKTRSFTEGSSQETVYEGITFTSEAVDYGWVPEDAYWEAGEYRKYADEARVADGEADGDANATVTVTTAADVESLGLGDAMTVLEIAAAASGGEDDTLEKTAAEAALDTTGVVNPASTLASLSGANALVDISPGEYRLFPDATGEDNDNDGENDGNIDPDVVGDDAEITSLEAVVVDVVESAGGKISKDDLPRALADRFEKDGIDATAERAVRKALQAGEIVDSGGGYRV